MAITLTARPASGIRSGQRRNWMAPAPAATTRHGMVSADGGTLIDFRVTGNSVRITTTDTSWNKQIVRVSITAARVEYRRLLKSGYRAGSACMSR